MGYDAAGNYTRQRNFSADASAGINILASAMDQEIDDFASAMSLPLLKDGRNAATANIPMGGNRFINVGAATSVSNYMRSREFIENTPIYMLDEETSAGGVVCSSQYFTSVSANQAPGDGTRIAVRAFSDKSSSILYLDGHSANIQYQDGARIGAAMVSGGIYWLTYSSAASAWKIENPDWGITSAENAAGVVPVLYRFEPGRFERYGADPTQTNDSFSAITDCFAQAAQASGAAAHTFGGVYLVSDTVELKKGADLFMRNAWIKADPSFTNTYVFTTDTASAYNGTIDGLWVDGNYTSAICVHFPSVAHTHARNIKAYYGKGGGILQTAGYELILSQFETIGPDATVASADTSAYGLKLLTGDHEISQGTNVRWPYGLWTVGGSNNFSQIHNWSVYTTAQTQMRIGFLVDGQGCAFTQCVADSPGMLDTGAAVSKANGGYGWYIDPSNNGINTYMNQCRLIAASATNAPTSALVAVHFGKNFGHVSDFNIIDNDGDAIASAPFTFETSAVQNNTHLMNCASTPDFDPDAVLSWTPVLEFGGSETATYASGRQKAVVRYDESTRRCWAKFHIGLSAKGAGSGDITVTGLPKTAITEGNGAVTIGTIRVHNPEVANCQLQLADGGTSLSILQSDGTTLQAADVSTTTNFQGVVEYIVDEDA